MHLSPRLEKIASLIPVGSSIADVGTDHAYIPVYCFEQGIITKAIAMDINPMPLERARENISKYGYSSMAELCLSNGLEKLAPGDADVIVIAGMGGLLIADIIRAGAEVISDDTLLLLQPMIAPSELRLSLIEGGFKVENEYVVREENKYYNIMAVRRGKCVAGDELVYIGANLAANSPETVADYIDYKIRVCTKILSGHRKSHSPDTHSIEAYTHELDVYQRYKKELNLNG